MQIRYRLPRLVKAAPCLLLFLLVTSCAQPSVDLVPTLEFAQQLEAEYPAFRYAGISTRRFSLEDIQPAIDALGPAFTVSEVGRSVENRRINRVEWGNGPTQVLLWSQMHGDEPTATAALLDVFRWLAADGEATDSIRTLLKEKLTLTFLPMLNPDGAARFSRRNALGVDLNRDALRLQSPEARVLKNERDRLQADWGFNLHDQSAYYGVDFPAIANATISILAPAYDWEKSMNPQREDAAQLIGLMNRSWQQTTPNGVGRYNDDFEPRAFGDNLQKWGTRTILIESGGLAGDREKQTIRRMNFVGILSALHGIATGSFEAISLAEYWDIPENSSNAYHDLLIRNVTVNRPEGEFLMDIAMRQTERVVPDTDNQFYLDGYISDVGDLHTFRGHQELDGTGLTAKVGMVYPEILDRTALQRLNPKELYAQGYTAIQVRDYKPAYALDFEEARLISIGRNVDTNIYPGSGTDLLLYRNGVLEKVIINGVIR